MASFNKVIIVGNITRDIELKYTPAGMPTAQLGLAINNKWRDQKTNQMKEDVTFVDVDLFGKTAELAAQYLTKGRSALIEGRLKFDQWTDKQTGQKRSKLKVVGDKLQFLGGGEKGDSKVVRDPQAQQQNQFPEEASGVGGAELDIQEESIPF